MDKLLDITKVEYKNDAIFLLEFENGQKRIFDMTPFLDKKPFNKLKKLQLIDKVSIAYGTIVWPGNIDIDPETVWDCSLPTE